MVDTHLCKLRHTPSVRFYSMKMYQFCARTVRTARSNTSVNTELVVVLCFLYDGCWDTCGTSWPVDCMRDGGSQLLLVRSVALFFGGIIRFIPTHGAISNTIDYRDHN